MPDHGYCPKCDMDVMPIGKAQRCPDCGTRVPKEHRAIQPNDAIDHDRYA